MRGIVIGEAAKLRVRDGQGLREEHLGEAVAQAENGACDVFCRRRRKLKRAFRPRLPLNRKLTGPPSQRGTSRPPQCAR